MQCAVATFRIRNGLGTQSVTNIFKDRQGVPFLPKHIFFVHGSSVKEVLQSDPDGVFNAAAANTNSWNVETQEGSYNALTDATTFGFKTSSSGGGNGYNAGWTSLKASAWFGGYIIKYARITSVYVGGFDLEVFADDIIHDTDTMVMALGGNDFFMEWAVGSDTPPDYEILSPNFIPRGMLNFKGFLPASGLASNVNTGAGGAFGWGWGWDTPNGGPMSSHVYIGSQNSGNFKFQDLDCYQNQVVVGSTDGTYIINHGDYIVQWKPASMFNSGRFAPHQIGYIIGGPNIKCSSGAFIQSPSVGQQFIDLKVNASAVLLISIGEPPSPTAYATDGSCCFGWTNGSNQSLLWFGERSNFNPPLMGATYLSEASLLVFASNGPQGPSTEFTTVGKIAGLKKDGTLIIDWTLNDGIGRQILWFAIGVEPTPTPSGLYYINPNKTDNHDSYYGGLENKIPNPIIKTALLGE